MTPSTHLVSLKTLIVSLTNGVIMLVLTRKKGESFLINGNVQIKILSNTNRKTRIGIDAPQHINIVRSELLLKNEKQDAIS